VDSNKEKQNHYRRRSIWIGGVVLFCICVAIGIVVYCGTSGHRINGVVSKLSELPKYSHELETLETSGPIIYTFFTTYRMDVVGIISGKIVSQERLEAFARENVLKLQKYPKDLINDLKLYDHYLHQNKDQYNTRFSPADIVFTSKADVQFAPFSKFVIAYRPSDNGFSIFFEIYSDRNHK
jgi:hypothetical protein